VPLGKTSSLVADCAPALVPPVPPPCAPPAPRLPPHQRSRVGGDNDLAAALLALGSRSSSENGGDVQVAAPHLWAPTQRRKSASLRHERCVFPCMSPLAQPLRSCCRSAAKGRTLPPSRIWWQWHALALSPQPWERSSTQQIGVCTRQAVVATRVRPVESAVALSAHVQMLQLTTLWC